MAKIVFFNHFHRGDLHTNKEYIRQIMQELPDVEFEYLHANPNKLLLDLNIPTKRCDISVDFVEMERETYKKTRLEN